MMAGLAAAAPSRFCGPANDCSLRGGFFVKTDLIDRIYECSIVPDLWPGVLDDLAELADSRGGLLFSARDRVLKWTASANLKDIFRVLCRGWMVFALSAPGLPVRPVDAGIFRRA